MLGSISAHVPTNDLQFPLAANRGAKHRIFVTQQEAENHLRKAAGGRFVFIRRLA
ncbi:hypothetical protein BFJ72_g10038 [Fusarium proliferatum]|uniref:Uncharacterized protein n=1 Tax=Gibberella intermedia TaxID=948311 RepID=A0A420SWB4_GIBIN|nr:hypothetical protein BFJ72_g10038 [Fusarium proliferatum]